MKITEQQLKQIIAEEIENVLLEQGVPPETWEPHVKSVEVEMKILFPPDFRKKLLNALAVMKPQPTSKQADRIIRYYAIKVKAKTATSKTAPSGEGEWTRGTGAREKCMRMCKGETNMHSCMQRNCPEFVA